MCAVKMCLCILQLRDSYHVIGVKDYVCGRVFAST